jgi:tetratricopeptide (TPR) repeat protein
MGLRKGIIRKQEAAIEKLERRAKKGIDLMNQKKYEAALLIFQALAKEEIIRKSPQSMISVLINLGIVYFQLQNYQESIRAFLRVLKKNRINPIPKEAKERTKLGIAFSVILKLAFANKEEQALKLCEFRINKNPDNILLIEMKANLLYALKRYEDSIFCFEEFLEKAGESVNKDQVFYKIGLNYLELKELNAAQNYFQRGANINPRNHLNFLGLGQVDWEKKEWPEVIKHLERVERLAPKEIDFLLSMIQCYHYCGLSYRAVPKIQRIIKSNNRIIIAQLLNWLIKEVKDIKVKGHLLKKIIQDGQKSPAFWEELQNILRINGSYPYLSNILSEIKKEAENQPKKNRVLINSLKDIEKLISIRNELIEKYFSLVGWLISKKEIEDLFNEYPTKEGNALEASLVEKMKTKYRINQGEWIGFTEKIKEEKGEVFYSLKGIADFLDRIEGMKNTEAVFDSCQKEGMTIEEKTNQLIFKIFPDFPGKLKPKSLSLVIDFYEERLKLWEELPSLIVEKTIIPPNYATIEQWAKKNNERLPQNQILLEEIQREGNSLKMDIISQKLRPHIYQMAYPIVTSLLEGKSGVLAARFYKKGSVQKENGDNYCSLLALNYFKYIRKEMKVK